MVASFKGHTDIVALLLEAGADVDAQNNGGITALIMASATGQTDIVSLLLTADADVDAQDNAGRTALMVSSGEGHADIVATLPQTGDYQIRPVEDLSEEELANPGNDIIPHQRLADGGFVLGYPSAPVPAICIWKIPDACSQKRLTWNTTNCSTAHNRTRRCGRIPTWGGKSA